MPDSEYYSFFAALIERVYEPLPWTKRPSGRYFHRPTAIVYVLGLLVFVAVPYLWDASKLSILVGTPWRPLPVGMKLYYLVVYSVIIAVGVLVGWCLTVGYVFMGKRIGRKTVRLDVTKKATHLGLEPYSRMIFFAAFMYILTLTISALFVIQQVNIFVLLGYGIMTLMCISGVIVSHYGLYVAIRSSKRTWLAGFRERYSQEIESWFVNGSGETDLVFADGYEKDELHAFGILKGQIEELPNWPFDIRRFEQFIAAVVASNLSILLRSVL
ncbi:hypothetical protein BRC81_04280 [Halobacteriales archaeon QS_1_68_20]|nr:MAG: hypothetical protein BRC81_04280 [Halobacteriales archaeon QS_1_68_20]